MQTNKNKHQGTEYKTKEFGRIGSAWLSLLPHRQWGRQVFGNWRRSEGDCWTIRSSVNNSTCSTATCVSGISPFNHCFFFPLIVHPWLADPVLFDAALPLYLHIPRVSGNGAGNLALQGFFTSLEKILNLNKGQMSPLLQMEV